MATTTLPRQAGIGRGRWLIGSALLIAAIIAAVVYLSAGGQASAPSAATARVTRGAVVATVRGTGTIAAAQSLDLPFALAGTVGELLVREGDTVAAGQALAVLDSRDLALQVANAEAQLATARARLGQAQSGNARPDDIGATEAAVANAAAQQRAAQAQLDALKNPSAKALGDAESSVQQATIDLQAQRDTGSAAKTRAEQDLSRSVAALTQAQSKYATTLQNWQHVQDTGTDPINPSKTDTNGKTKPNTLNDAQRQQYYDAFVQAEAAMHSAEDALQQAQVAYDSARQQEIANIQKAEARLADVQRQLAALRSPSKTDLTQRQASVDQARAGVAQAQANLAKLSAPGTASDITIQQAAVAQAEQQLEQARLKLEQATLRAPFGGVVAEVRVVPGSLVSSATPVLSLVDRSVLRIDLKLSENDVAKVQLGQPVALTIDALQAWQTQGVVGYIAPAAESSNGVVTYRVRVDFSAADERVKVGMTANLAITAAQKEGVLLVPNTALLPKGAGRVVQLPNADGTTREAEVQTGLTDGVYTEITGGLSEGDTIVAVPGAQAPRSSGGLFGGGVP